MLGFQTQEMEMGYNKRDGIALAACFPLTLAVFLPAFILSAAILIVLFYIAGIFWMISVVIPLAAIVTPYLISSIETVCFVHHIFSYIFFENNRVFIQFSGF